MPPVFEEGTFKAADGTELYLRYLPHPEARQTILILHGHGEHCCRYDKVFKVLHEKRLNVAAMDFRGHGRSGGSRVYVRRFDDFIQDVSAFERFLGGRYGLKPPFFLLGHSNGGLVAAQWALAQPEKVYALILSSPFLGIRMPKFLIYMNAVFNLIMPGMIYKNPVYPPYLTHNLAEVDLYKSDKLIQRRISVRLFQEMISAIQRLKDRPSLDVPFPVYILMAGLERVVDGTSTRAFYEKLQAPDKSLEVFDGFYHEIFNELGQEKVFESLRHLIDRARKLKG